MSLNTVWTSYAADQDSTAPTVRTAMNTRNGGPHGRISLNVLQRGCLSEESECDHSQGRNNDSGSHDLNLPPSSDTHTNRQTERQHAIYCHPAHGRHFGCGGSGC